MSVEPSISEMIEAAEVAWRNVLVAESQSMQPNGCCADASWRGHLCQYHQGYEDGIDVVLERLRAIEQMMRPPA